MPLTRVDWEARNANRPCPSGYAHVLCLRTLSAVCPRSGSVILVYSQHLFQPNLLDSIPDDLDVAYALYILHRLRRDEDVLTSNGTTGSANDHLHGDRAIGAIHKHVTSQQSVENCRLWVGSTYNSSKQRIGEPMASQRESSKQMVENDFSPPESVLVCLAALPSIVESGWI